MDGSVALFEGSALMQIDRLPQARRLARGYFPSPPSGACK